MNGLVLFVSIIYFIWQTLESETSDDVENNHKPPSNWPQMGSICFDKVKMRYQPHLPFVLKSISFEIEPKEKIGKSHGQYFKLLVN